MLVEMSARGKGDPRGCKYLKELLAHDVPRALADEYAEKLMARMGSLRAVAEAEEEDLRQIAPISDCAAQTLRMLPGLATICSREQMGAHVCLDSLDKVGDYAKVLFYGVRYEKFYMFCLDQAFCLLECEFLCEGTVNETPFYPRVIAERALRSDCAYVVFVHNHPGGNRNFSVMDFEGTLRAGGLLADMGVALLDHLIITTDQPVSMRRSGVIEENRWLKYAPDAEASRRWMQPSPS